MILLLEAASPSWTGSIPTWILVALALFAGWRITRGGGGSAVTELSESNKVLTDALEKAREVADKQAKQIAALESKTDVVLAVTPLISEHERMAGERHQATIHVLEAISDRLNGDTLPAKGTS